MSSEQTRSQGESKSKRLIYGYIAFACLLTMAAFSVATQQVASAYGFHAALGTPFFKEWYLPWRIIQWAQQFPQTAEVINDATATGQIVFVLPQLVVLGIWQFFFRMPKAFKALHGTARWAKRKDIEEADLLGSGGVYVGGWQEDENIHYLQHNGAEHILAFAPTRSGKGVGLVLPTLLSWPESALILDIKGENWAVTAGWRQKQGHKVLRFEPTDDEGAGARFNPLEEIRLGSGHAIADTQNIASMIVDPDGKGLKDYWNKAAFALLGGAILHCLIQTKHEKNRTATLNDLGLILADPEKDIDTLLQEMLHTDHASLLQETFGTNRDTATAIKLFIASSAREMLNKADNELSGVVSTAVANLALYRDPIVAANTSTCDFRIADLMNYESPVSLYLVILPSDIDRLRPLIRLILNILLRRLTEKMEFADGRSVAGYKYRLLLMMDEFTSLGKLEIFERSLAFMAGYGLKAYFIVQDLKQLYAAYTKEESIVSNCHVRVAYAPNNIETAEALSKMTGQQTVITQKTSLSGSRSGHLNRASVSLGETKRFLLTPDECMRLPGAKKEDGKIVEAGDMLIFPSGFYPIYGKQILYFLDPVFDERSKIEAPELSDRLVENAKPPVVKSSSTPFTYTVEPEPTQRASVPEDVPEFEEPNFDEEFDGEEPDFDELEDDPAYSIAEDMEEESA